MRSCLFLCCSERRVGVARARSPIEWRLNFSSQGLFQRLSDTQDIETAVHSSTMFLFCRYCVLALFISPIQKWSTRTKRESMISHTFQTSEMLDQSQLAKISRL